MCRMTMSDTINHCGIWWIQLVFSLNDDVIMLTGGVFVCIFMLCFAFFLDSMRGTKTLAR